MTLPISPAQIISAHLPRAFVRIALVAHLRGDFVFVGRVHQLARFPDGAGQRLLHVDVLAALHGTTWRRWRA